MNWETHVEWMEMLADDGLPDENLEEPTDYWDSFTVQEIEEILAEDRLDELRLQKFIEEEGL